MNSLKIFICLLILFVSARAQKNELNNAAGKESETISLKINMNKEIGKMNPIWAWFGYDEPNYTYMKDGKKLLSELAQLSPVPVFVRVHNLLTTGDGTPALKWGSTNAYTEDKNGNPIYDWTIIDKIFDTYIERGMKPLAQIGFMPEALSTNPKPYQHAWSPDQPTKNIYTGWAYPPKDYNKWHELIYNWVKHSVERYGKKEVLTWYWEIWNEPDGGYWKGTHEEYCKLYDYSVDAVKKALPEAKVGGPHVTGPVNEKGATFLKKFLEHCVDGKNYVTGKKGTVIDFIAFHAKGSPKIVDNHVQMNMARQLGSVSNGFEIVASFPTLKKLPVIIGESDPEGCAACSMDYSPQNAYRNGTMYSSYTAASFARKYELADHFKINFLGAVTWAFEFENQPWFNGFRDLATNGVDKPVLNVFRMFGMMSGSRVEVSGDQEYNFQSIRDSSVRGAKPDVNAIASKNKNELAVMVWNYHDNDLPAAPSNVEIQINGLTSKKVLMHHYRIDNDHSNSYEVWKKIGSPQNPTPEQIKILENSGQLQMLSSPEWITTNNVTTVKFLLPRHAVSLLIFQNEN